MCLEGGTITKFFNPSPQEHFDQKGFKNLGGNALKHED